MKVTLHFLCLTWGDGPALSEARLQAPTVRGDSGLVRSTGVKHGRFIAFGCKGGSSMGIRRFAPGRASKTRREDPFNPRNLTVGVKKLNRF